MDIRGEAAGRAAFLEEAGHGIGMLCAGATMRTAGCANMSTMIERRSAGALGLATTFGLESRRTKPRTTTHGIPIGSAPAMVLSHQLRARSCCGAEELCT